ncbi:MAG: ABC transporter ATP-binding protein [Defluviitoga tunisiensis]|uniref:ABC-type nitrate/sulfonate/bicarbonate transport system, ATPase component n=1 Tax=Defluviitoga tunisiensis TaxID=1006576 RepID=A0A0C7NXP1_DEFTU|nr:ABC transporter ATP-binding protein [Defluviitoga tunisiensis]MDD3601357.1 ABC transporter ATP-binding protein [Defluviitoga tunisiensis]MDY0379833.1 ABC transporter ATP-binding protein [Defluviitoga tunisiensis]CEP78103.1 ABC-type nitrate/sulfonate/bicarbonate transport system, ATPase component [Defluviitoga tunisiensis]HHV01662.1 ABC transporter ATP-binding protein [Defluviitoga tunisiensis]HOB55909.1 ABC transporter ATP-binding protein [Defluviitoga tunisiensis]
MGNILKVSNLSKNYGNLQVINGWDIELEEGEKVVLVGPSGCGKTTFFRIISGLEKATGGTVDVFAQKVGYVFQEPRLFPWRTVFDNLRIIRDEEDKIEEVIKMMSLEGFEQLIPSKLSGGMKQRVNLARALLIEPDFLILDEPFSSLDLKIKLAIMNDIEKLWSKYKFSLLMVTHDLKEAIFLADKVIILSSRPSKILRTFDINLEMNERDITDKHFLELESKITRFIINETES